MHVTRILGDFCNSDDAGIGYCFCHTYGLNISMMHGEQFGLMKILPFVIRFLVRA